MQLALHCKITRSSDSSLPSRYGYVVWFIHLFICILSFLNTVVGKNMFLDTFKVAQNLKCCHEMLCGKSVVAASYKYKQMQIILIDCLFIVNKKIKTTSGTCPGCVLTRGILYYPAEMFSIDQQWVNALVKYIVKLHVSAVRLPFVDDSRKKPLFHHYIFILHQPLPYMRGTNTSTPHPLYSVSGVTAPASSLSSADCRRGNSSPAPCSMPRCDTAVIDG